jgi:hypothetical protein
MTPNVIFSVVIMLGFPTLVSSQNIRNLKVKRRARRNMDVVLKFFKEFLRKPQFHSNGILLLW